MSRRHRPPRQAWLLELTPRPREVTFGESPGRLWTDNKARLIAEYIRGFQRVTKHGTYIDGFAAPQEDGIADSWSAELVLRLDPPWLRHFHLCDLPRRVHFLERLRLAFPERDVQIYAGDFNRTVHDILKPETIGEKEATFCLLDQWSTECHWTTVQALARHKSGSPFKIELFYFLAVGWLFRKLKVASRPKTLQDLESWYGDGGWEALTEMNIVEMSLHFRARFEKLGYAYVTPWAIFERADPDSRIMYYMIHATDHPDAPKLMERAYAEVVAEIPGAERPLPGLDNATLRGH